jgi:hypothetical protein
VLSIQPPIGVPATDNQILCAQAPTANVLPVLVSNCNMTVVAIIPEKHISGLMFLGNFMYAMT